MKVVLLSLALFRSRFEITSFAALRTDSALVAGEVVAALLAVAWWDSAAVAVEKDGGGDGNGEQGQP